MSADERAERLGRTDLEHLWHPFTQQKLWQEFGEPLVVERAHGFELIDIHGRRYLDGISSLWCNVHGHGVPEITAALREQVGSLLHSTLLGLSHVPALELTEELFRRWLPPHLSRVFFSDSGSAAVEAALRMALEWWKKNPARRGLASAKREKFASLENGYHGDTMGSVGVGFTKLFHGALGSAIVPSLTVPPPHIFRFFKQRPPEAALDASLEVLEELFRREGNQLAAFIVEPLCQGAAGIWTHPPEYLRAVSDLCRQYDVLLIVDEVATGFGKSGKMFAFEQVGIRPDLLILGKGLTGGMLPLSAVVTTEQVYSGFLGEPEEFCAFYFGQTFAGNPLACRAALVNLRLFEQGELLQRVPAKIASYHRAIERHLRPLEHVDEVRSLGLMTGIELTVRKGAREPFLPASRATWRIVAEARSRGLIVRPLGNVMILMPAVGMPEEDMVRVVELMGEAIKAAL